MDSQESVYRSEKKHITFHCKLTKKVKDYQKLAFAEQERGNLDAAIKLYSKAYQQNIESLNSALLLSTAYRLKGMSSTEKNKPKLIEFDYRFVSLNILRRIVLTGEAKLHEQANWGNCIFTEDSLENHAFAKAMMYLASAEIIDVRNKSALNLIANVLIGFEHLLNTSCISQLLFYVSKSGNMFSELLRLLEIRQADAEIIAFVKKSQFLEYFDPNTADFWIVSQEPISLKVSKNYLN